ncbi:MAG: N utilization substance protein B [Verrucomicrobiales bacterium]|jgi:N utilization substance protein B
MNPLNLSRREDRETGLALLYEADMTGDDMSDVLDRNHADEDDYGTSIAAGVAANLDSLDLLIDRIAEDWSVSRMAGIDRSILRMGAWELVHRAEVPTTAVVSEAVALANQYSTEKSAPFINGILVKLAANERDEATI